MVSASAGTRTLVKTISLCDFHLSLVKLWARDSAVVGDAGCAQHLELKFWFEFRQNQPHIQFFRDGEMVPFLSEYTPFPRRTEHFSNRMGHFSNQIEHFPNQLDTSNQTGLFHVKLDVLPPLFEENNGLLF